MPIVGQGQSGSINKSQNCCRWDTSIWSSPCRTNSTRLILVNKKISVKSSCLKPSGRRLLSLAALVWADKLGIIAVLHTWDQTLLDHFHLHCLVPAGALSFDQTRWIPARQNFLFPVKALSRVFRGKFLDLLKKSFDQNKLLFVGQIAPLANADSFDALFNALRKKPWVVYAKKPFGSPVHVLDYFGRYTHRVALSNDRILSPITERSPSLTAIEKIKNRQIDDTRRRGVHSTLLAPRHPQGFHAGASLRLFSQPIQSLSVQVSSTHGPYASTEPNLPTASVRRVDAGTDRHRYPSLPALPKRNAGLGFRRWRSLYRGILREDRSSNQNTESCCCSVPEPTHGCILFLHFACF